MKYILLAILLVFTACKTCPDNKIISDHLSTAIVGHFECGDSQPIILDIEKAVSDMDYCGDFDSTKYVQALPDGNWTAKAICCWAVLPKLKEKAKHWKCKKDIKFKTLVEECQTLE